MRKERNSKDLLLDAILLRALEEENKGLEREIRAANEALTKEEDERLKALLKATWKKEQTRQRRNRYLLRTTACFAVMLVVSFSVVMNVQAWRSNVVNYVLTVFDDHGVLSPQKSSHTTDQIQYLPTYIPKRYSQKEIIQNNDNSLMISYIEEDGSSAITFQILYKGTSLYFDSEDANIETIWQDGQEMMILLKEEERQLLGTIPGTTYRFMIAGELTEEEILDIANSIQPEKEE